MLVTAELKRRGRVVSDNILMRSSGAIYTVSEAHTAFVGPTLAVVAGPHKDFDKADVYTVELSSPPAGASLPFFNSEGWWEYLTIEIE